MKKLIYTAALLLFTILNNAQNYTPQDKEIYAAKAKIASDAIRDKAELNAVISKVASSFAGTDYVGFTLETDGPEVLTVNFRGLDCTTFLETAVTVARTCADGKDSFEEYLQKLEEIRYRGGKLNGYPSRLHYFSDWIYDNVKKGIIKDISREIGGEKIVFNVSFMGNNPKLYMMLKGNDEFLKQIKQQEKEIAAREYYYIPNSRIKDVQDKIMSGDLIGIVTSVEGLDISHTGFAYRGDDNVLKFLHAPMAGKKVEITKKPLADYIPAIQKSKGIVVLRAVSH
ncbi:MAG: DUF1460 domain-containing protein [Ignavibacteriaceae bacterium]|nr:DUF1460 domain-containing protein [Ignavibacteriaceae bacterium]